MLLRISQIFIKLRATEGRCRTWYFGWYFQWDSYVIIFSRDGEGGVLSKGISGVFDFERRRNPQNPLGIPFVSITEYYRVGRNLAKQTAKSS